MNLRSSRLIATDEGFQPFRIIPYSGRPTPEDLSVSRNEGGLSQRCSSIPFGNHAWTLSSRTTTAMRSRLCPTLSEELSSQQTHAFPLTYSLDTGGRPDGHGSMNIVNKASRGVIHPKSHHGTSGTRWFVQPLRVAVQANCGRCCRLRSVPAVAGLTENLLGAPSH